MNNTRQNQYTTRLQAGLGLIEETKTLLELWRPGMGVSELHRAALDSGRFPNVTARRLRNIVAECFAPRYLIDQGTPANVLRELRHSLSSSELNQLFFIFTCRANAVLADFVKDVYWERYQGGHSEIRGGDATDFIVRANQEGKTRKYWSETTIKRVTSYLLGCCQDYGLIEREGRSTLRILPFRIEPSVQAFLAYDLHFSGLGDNAVIAADDWRLFGLAREDVVDELKRLSRQGYFIVQTAGGVTHMSWNCSNWEEFIDAIT